METRSTEGMQRPAAESAQHDADYAAKSRYSGDTAELYVQRRRNSRKWRTEQRIFNTVLAQLPPEISILDVPVGTGRFIHEYVARGHSVIGVDVSAGMLAEARGVASGTNGRIRLVRGDAEQLPLPARAVDCAVSFRFLNWLPGHIAENVIAELVRVSRRWILVEVRLRERPTPLTLLRRITNPRVISRLLAWPFRRAVAAVRPRRSGRPSGSGSVVHDSQRIEALFRIHGLEVLSMRYVDEGQDGLNGIRYPVKVFLLQKIATA